MGVFLFFIILFSIIYLVEHQDGWKTRSILVFVCFYYLVLHLFLLNVIIDLILYNRTIFIYFERHKYMLFTRGIAIIILVLLLFFIKMINDNSIFFYLLFLCLQVNQLLIILLLLLLLLYCCW